MTINDMIFWLLVFGITAAVLITAALIRLMIRLIRFLNKGRWF